MRSGNTELRGRKGSNLGEMHPIKERRKEQLRIWWKDLVGWNGQDSLPFSPSQAIKIKWQINSSQKIIQQKYQYVLMLESCSCR